MLYKLAHLLRDHCSCVWNALEWGNGLLFTMFLGGALKQIPDILKEYEGQYTYRLATERDVKSLVSFFAHQPQESFIHFNPHGFDEKSFKQVCDSKAFLMFIACDKDDIIGYFFLRCYVGGKAFRGKYVDVNYQGQGIATEMGRILSHVAKLLQLKVYGSISPENYASLASARKSNNLNIIKTLENGDLYIEFIDKNDR